MVADPPPWAPLHSRVSALPADRRAAFALACAEHLVRASATRPELLVCTAAGWAALAGRTRDVSDHLVALEGRDDLDEDDVACVTHALRALVGPVPARSALEAADRAVAAAYDRVSYPPDATAFRPLAEDTQDPVVQQELTWQATILAVLEDVADFPDACRQLRSLVS